VSGTHPGVPFAGTLMNHNKEIFMKFNIKSFALTTGLVAGIGLFLLTWWIMIFEGATYKPTFIGMVYRGYNISPLGSVIGLVWAFFDGLICGAVFAWLYNFLSGASKEKADTV